MVREVSFNGKHISGKPVVGKPVKFKDKEIGHIVKIKDGCVICAIDDDGVLISHFRKDDSYIVEVVRR